MEIIYMLTLENYKGENTFELFHHKENAVRRYNELLKENCRKEEFECDGDDEDYDDVRTFSFFDPHYNECSTFITFTKSTMDRLFED